MNGHWFWWTLIGLLALGVVLNVAAVGEPRKPIAPLSAAFQVIVNALLIVGIVIYGLL